MVESPTMHDIRAFLNDAEGKLLAPLACQNNARQTGGQSTWKPLKCNAPRRTRTPSLLIRSHVHRDSKRHAATRHAIFRRRHPIGSRRRRSGRIAPEAHPLLHPLDQSSSLLPRRVDRDSRTAQIGSGVPDAVVQVDAKIRTICDLTSAQLPLTFSLRVSFHYLNYACLGHANQQSSSAYMRICRPETDQHPRHVCSETVYLHAQAVPHKCSIGVNRDLHSARAVKRALFEFGRLCSAALGMDAARRREKAYGACAQPTTHGTPKNRTHSHLPLWNGTWAALN